MERLKVMTILGTRPEVIRLSRVLSKLEKFFDHVLVHTGQNYDYELNEIFFEELDLKPPDIYLDAAGGSPMETIGAILPRVDQILGKYRPDALLVLGDTNSCLSVIPAKRRKIPIFHMEAGNRSFDMRVPEEINRRIVDHTADVNLTYSSIAREYLISEGLPPDLIIKTGSPMFEVLHTFAKKIDSSNILTELKVKSHKFFVVSVHREENVDSDYKLNQLVRTLNRIAEKYALPVVVSTHPRTRSRLNDAGYELHPLVGLHKPFGFLAFVKLEQNAKAVLSDSGTISEESSILNFPALNLREAHERPEGFEEAAVMLTGLNSERVIQALEILAEQPRGSERALELVYDYGRPNVSDKVVRIIQSYTDYVNRVVWKDYK